jgi:hypothetical protein
MMGCGRPLLRATPVFGSLFFLFFLAFLLVVLALTLFPSLCFVVSATGREVLNPRLTLFVQCTYLSDLFCPDCLFFSVFLRQWGLCFDGASQLGMEECASYVHTFSVCPSLTDRCAFLCLAVAWWMRRRS